MTGPGGLLYSGRRTWRGGSGDRGAEYVVAGRVRWVLIVAWIAVGLNYVAKLPLEFGPPMRALANSDRAPSTGREVGRQLELLDVGRHIGVGPEQDDIVAQDDGLLVADRLARVARRLVQARSGPDSGRCSKTWV